MNWTIFISLFSAVILLKSVTLVLASANNETDTANLTENSTDTIPKNSTRDARVLSFIRNLLFPPSSNNGNQNQPQVQQQHGNYYPKIDKYGEYNAYPVNSQYQIGSNNGGVGAAYRPGQVLPAIHPNQNYPAVNPSYSNQNYPTANPNYPKWPSSSTSNNDNYAQLLLNQANLAGAGLASNSQTDSSSSSLTNLITKLGLNVLGAGAGLSGADNNLNSNLNSNSNEFDPTSILSKIFDLGTNSMESLITRMNKFDKLKCIPRLVCQTIARRAEEAAAAALTTTSTTTSTRRPRLLKIENVEVSPETETLDKESERDARFIKIQGLDTALQQFVSFLDLMQLKDWSLYPLLNGAYQGSQVRKWDECREKFETCPFSDQQLVYYFNNYNGGFFQTV